MAGGSGNFLGARELVAESADDPKVIVRHVLDKDIDFVRRAVETYDLGTSVSIYTDQLFTGDQNVT